MNYDNVSDHLAGRTRVGVVGAGICGLVATKICLENDLQVTCFDRSSKYGGLWRYRPDEADEGGPFEPSVMKTTVLNTSKETSAFSDFPPPAHLPNFMRHDQYMDYIDSYVRHFRLEPHLRLEHEIVKCWPEWREPDATNPSQHIQWLVQTRHSRTGESALHEFDRLMVAIGHHNIPFTPTHEGLHKFQGRVLHSAWLKDIPANKRLAGKRVLVVGFGNSACDAANDIASIAEKCYVSCHRGNWLYGRSLSPFSRWQQYLDRLIGGGDKRTIKFAEARVNHQLLGLRPDQRPSQLAPAINDMFPYRILTGAITLKNSVKTFTETGAIFEGEEDEEYPIDVAVLATGYEAKLTFIDELELGIKSAKFNNEYELFLNIFAPNLTLRPHAFTQKSSERNGLMTSNGLGGEGKQGAAAPCMDAVKSLAFIGLVQGNGSMTAVAEMQARYACLVFKGQLQLPKMSRMLEEIERMRRQRARFSKTHSRDVVITSYLDYMERVASYAGVMPNLRKLFFKDHTLWRHLMFGPTVPYQYRLAGPGLWPEARQTVLATPDRINAGINDGKNQILYRVREERRRGSDHRRKQ